MQGLKSLRRRTRIPNLAALLDEVAVRADDALISELHGLLSP